MNLKSAIESILFLQGEPVEILRLVKITRASKREVESALRELAGDYQERGIVLIENGDRWQFATQPENKAVVEAFLKADVGSELSRAGLEILAIIAYKGPTSRAKIEYIRGINSSFTLRNLLIRGLVERDENPKDKRSYLYRVSVDFLKHLGLQRLNDLPRYEEFRSAEVEIPGPPPEEKNEPESHANSEAEK